MHEVWLGKTILELVQKKLQDCKAKRVKKITLELGQLAAIDKEALLFSFGLIAKGSAAESAELEIQDISGEAFCESCQYKMSLQHYYDECQNCGGHRWVVTQGEALRVKSMVVE